MNFLNKLLQINRKRSKQAPNNNKETSTSSEDDFSAQGAPAPSSPKNDSSSPAPSVDSEASAMILAVGKRFFEGIANQDAAAVMGNATEDCEVSFKDQELGLAGFGEEAVKIWKAFPDFHLTCPHGFQVEKDDKGQLYCITRKCVPNGHHTGAPYGFGPYEPIPPTNKYVKNAPETFHMYVNGDGKVYRVVIYAEGEMTGPAGIYQQIGGFPIL